MRTVTYTDDADVANAVADELESTLVQRRQRALAMLKDPAVQRDEHQTRFQQQLVERLNLVVAALGNGLLERLAEEIGTEATV